MKSPIAIASTLAITAFLSCSSGARTTEGLHPAFAEFDDENTDIYIQDGQVVVETNGLPNHTSPYWGEGHPMYEEPTEAMRGNMAPSIIPNYDGAATLRLPLVPKLAASPTATTLGAIGISVSGAAIFNDEEGNGPLSEGIASGLDTSGGHIGPAEYHYHLEPKAISDDDDKLIGVLADGMFIYGRKCNSTGDYPTDLDDSGGHTHVTQHSTEPEYHYHVQNSVYLDRYYIIFPGDFRGELGSFDGGRMGPPPGGMGPPGRGMGPPPPPPPRFGH